MDKNMLSPFSTEIGERMYKTARDTVDAYSMNPLLSRGVLVGLSGGADSVALLYFLVELRRREGDFPIVAAHINHMIRGAEADRDEQFSRDLAMRLGVEFVCARVDVPTIAESKGIGVEEAAREARYSEFANITSSRNDISTIAVAHNATDNLETVIFNIMRGTGATGASGIAPVRDNIVRPLIDIDKATILEVLSASAVDYVTDSTNSATEYTRNFIRHNVVEPLREIFPNPERAASRLSRNLRLDSSYINSVADDFLKNEKTLRVDELLELHEAVFARVLSKLAAQHSSSLEEVHIINIRRLLRGGDFSLSIPGGVRFVSERSTCKILPEKTSSEPIRIPLSMGFTPIDDFGAAICIYRSDFEKISPNVYKNSIHADLSSAIISGELYLRPRRDGDTIFYGGHTHKLRKVYTDFKIPQSERDSLLLLCDDSGVVWVPGLAARDDGARVDGQRMCVDLFFDKYDFIPKQRLRTIAEYRINASHRENNK